MRFCKSPTNVIACVAFALYEFVLFDLAKILANVSVVTPSDGFPAAGRRGQKTRPKGFLLVFSVSLW
jgi:hypothetical protein